MKPDPSFLPWHGRPRVLTRPVLSGLALAAMLACASGVHAFSLGRMNVMSALGEPLRAEIDVTSLTAEQSASLQIGLAAAEVYRAAGMDYSELLRGTQVTLTRRADGRSVLQVTSDRAARDPFIDLILQATWSNGRLVREYTVLLDPPRPDAPPSAAPSLPLPSSVAVAPSADAPLGSAAAVPAPAPSSAAPSVAATPAPPVPALPPPRVTASRSDRTGGAPTGPSGAAQPAAAEGRGDRRVSTAAPSTRAPATPSAAPGSTAKVRARPDAASKPAQSTIAGRYTVRAGDTLYRIARDARPQTVSLDQMLVALYRSNPRAFSGDNMNRLLAGAVLSVPDAAAATAITAGEARQVIQAHSADMAEYRQRLAALAGPTGEGSATRATGRVETLVQDRKQPAAPAPDQLKLSQASVGSKPAAEAVVSQQAEAQDATRRQAELQRNIDAMKQIEGAGSAGTAVDTAAGGASSAGSSAAASPSDGTSVLPEIAGSPPGSPGSAAEAPCAGPATPEPAQALEVAATPGEPEDAHSPMLAMYGLAAGGALGTLLLALGGMRLLRRRRGKAGASFLSEREAIEPSGDLPAVPSLDDEPMTFDEAVAQRMAPEPGAGLEPADLRSADPVAEADVYMAYGRLQQAQALLQSAMRDEPHRLDIQVKLLEVYALQKDLEAFDAQAETLYEMTGGQGPEWTRALSLRRSLAPPPPPAAPRVAASTSFEDDVDLGFPAEPAGTLSPTLDANEVATMARAPRPMPPGASALPPRPPRADPVPSLGPEPEQTEAGDFALDLDATVAARAPRPQHDIDLGQTSMPGATDPDAGDPLDRKLALAEEFIQIGDVEGARAMLDEVGAKGDGPLRARAQRLLRTLD